MRRSNEFCWPAEPGAARQRGGNRGADTKERRGQPGRSAMGRSETRHEVERRAGGVRPGGRPGQRVPDHARRPGVPGASERAPREPGHTDPAAVSTAEATRTQPRADEQREERARRPAAASASASAPRTAKVEARTVAQWAQPGPRRAASAVAASDRAKLSAARGRDGDGAGSTERRVSPEHPRGLAAAGGDGRYRTGATLAGAEGGSSCRDGASSDGATGAAGLRISDLWRHHNLQSPTRPLRYPADPRLQHARKDPTLIRFFA
jgi:hypothetical protein